MMVLDFLKWVLVKGKKINMFKLLTLTHCRVVLVLENMCRQF